MVILGTLLAFLLNQYRSEIPFAITGNVASGLPTPSIPPFSTTVNGTEVPFTGMLKGFGGSLVTIPFVAILEIFAIAKAFGKMMLMGDRQIEYFINPLFYCQPKESQWMRVKR